LRQSKLSDKGNIYANDLFAYMLNQRVASVELSYSSFHAAILKKEEAILADKTLSELDKQILLSATSTARHFGKLWHDRQNIENSGGEKKRTWWQWLVIGVCDVAGAVIGAGTSPAGAVSAGCAASVLTNTLTN
jgi:hypothetical protein